MLNFLESPDLVLAGTSPAAHRLRTQIDRVAPYFRTALLVGEAGCLKEQIARALQRRSPLREHEFHVHHAGTIADETLDLEGPATLYIAGIGLLSAEQQKLVLCKLRKAFRTGRPELRFICSSDVAPRGLVAAGRLDAELYGCIGAVEIRLSPLRERVEDLPCLLRETNVHPEAMEMLGGHHWPGNLRELHTVLLAGLERAGTGMIGPEHLPPFAGTTMQKDDVRLDFVLRRHVNTVLETCGGNKLRAAEMLGISRSTLYRMLEAG